MNEAALEKLVIDNEAFEQLNAAMTVFCPFDSVGMSRQEVRHGFFLHHILDPARPHGFGVECLRMFMRAVAATLSDANSGIAPLDVHLMPLDDATIRREYKAIDLLIEAPRAKLVVAIELKIDASEHSGQLGRYRNIVEAEWPHHRRLLLFLTKHGEAPSEDGVGWHALPLAPVADALAEVVERGSGEPAARMMLSAYVGMLRRDHLGDERLERLAEGLWREHREALEFLMERRPDDRYAFMSLLLARHAEAATRLSDATGLRIEPDHATKSSVRFAVADWDDLSDFCSAKGWTSSGRAILLEVKESAGAVRPQFILGPAPRRQAMFDALQRGGADTGYKGSIGKSWRQLANVAFVPNPDDDVEDTFDKLIDVIAGFLKTHGRSIRRSCGRNWVLRHCSCRREQRRNSPARFRLANSRPPCPPT